jgi:acetyl esterase
MTEMTARLDHVGPGSVVVSVDYRLCTGGVTYPVPHDDVVAATRWVRENAAGLGADGGRISIGRCEHGRDPGRRGGGQAA